MKQLLATSIVSSLALLSACATTPAQPVDTLSVSQEVSINAPADVVWAKVSNFGDLGAWHPAVAKTEILEGTNNQDGAVRLLTLQDGGTVKEKLIAYDPSKNTYSYQILEGVLPVSGYASTIQVLPVTEKTSKVTWSSNFKRKDLSSHPAKGQDDESAVNTITAVYKAGLDNLKKISE